jgi:hypothetical protein
MPELGSVLFESRTVGVQPLGKYRVILQESSQTGLEDVHERGLWHGCLQLGGHCREVVLEVSKELLTFEYEPL